MIRNAYVMTMEPGVADIKGGDVHIKDGVIVEIGQFINATGAATLKGDGMIVMPA